MHTQFYNPITVIGLSVEGKAGDREKNTAITFDLAPWYSRQSSVHLKQLGLSNVLLQHTNLVLMPLLSCCNDLVVHVWKL